MTNSPNQDRNSQPSHRQRLLLMLLSRGGIAFAGLLTIGIVGGSWWLWNFVNKDLTPLAEEGISTSLNRPVKLGKLKNVSLFGVSFGGSSIPKTATDPDSATVAGVDVGFDLWSLIFQRRLKLDVTLVNPDVYIEQDSNGLWVSTTISAGGKGKAIKTELDNLRFRNGKLTLQPFRGQITTNSTQKSNIAYLIPTVPNTPISVSQVNGTAQLLEKNQLIKYEVGGKPGDGGSIFLRGESRPKTKTHNLEIQADDLMAPNVTRIVKLPVDLQAGQVTGDIKVQLARDEPAKLFGDVTAKNIRVQVARLPQLFTKTQGKLKFDDTEIKFENATGNYGKIPLIANGTIDRKTGFKLAGKVNSVSVANTQETLKLKLPLPVSGELRGDLFVTGELEAPILSGNIATTKPAKIDKVDFSNVVAKFEYVTRDFLISFRDIQGKPVVGGEVTGSGVVRVGENPGIDFNLLAQNVPGDALAKSYDIKPGFAIGTLAATARLAGASEQVQTLVRWQAPEAAYPGTGEVIINPNRRVDFRNTLLTVAGGKVKAAGTWINEKWQITADTSGIGIEQFVDKKQAENLILKGAEFNGRLLASGSTAPFKIDGISSINAGVDLGGGRVNVANFKLNQQNFVTQLVANNVRLSRVLKESAPVLQNPLAGTFVVAGNLDNLTLKTIQGTGDALLNVGGGTVAVNKIQLAQGNYQAQLRVNNSDVQELATVPEQVQGKVTGNFQVQGTVDSFELPNIQATGQGRLNVGNGVFNAANISLKDGNYQAKIQANNVPLQQFITGKIPPQINGGLNGLFNVAGNVESFKPEDIQLNGDAQLNVAGGTVNATKIQLNDGRYQALVNARGVELSRINSELTGQFGSQLQVSGVLDSENSAPLENLAAVGQVQLSRGLAGIEQPLTASIGWNGERLLIDQATSRDVTANGYVTVNAKGSEVPEITGLNLNVVAKNYNLKNLPTKLPSTLTLAGNAEFNGQITGTLPTPNLQGKVGIRNLDVNKLKFEPLLIGNIQSVQGSGLKLNLLGKQDRIALNLDANNRPQDFNVKWQQATATGTTQGQNLAVKVNNFPLTALNLTAPQNRFTGKGGVGGIFTGDLLVNKQNLDTSGNIAIAQPTLGNIKGNNLTAILNYSNGNLILENSSFIKGNSRYTLAGTFTPASPQPKIQGKITATQGNIQDILTTLQVFEITDFANILKEPEYGTVADLAKTQPVGLPTQSVLSQLQRISEIQALVENQQQQRSNASPIPELADLKGTFNGEVLLDTNSSSGLALQFQVNGQDFAWGRQDEPERYYQAQRIIAEGKLENGVLTLLPLRVESNDRLFAFTGSLGAKEQSGQLRVNNFPVKILNNFVKLPVGLSGNLSGTAAIAGNVTNPQAKGELRISEGALNAKGIESANASFSYNNGSLNFGSDINVVAGSEPVTINGSLFYPLPFAMNIPTSNQINLDVKVKNQGLSVINLFTNQLAFESGKGEVDLMVRGTVKEPTLKGTASLGGATFSALALPGKLTDVTGQAKFNLDRITVDNLQGRFSQGRIEAFGEIPISNIGTRNLDDASPSPLENPLTVNFDRLALNLKSLYQGGVSGSLQITGSALDPLIGGSIRLNNGQVLLSESTKTTTSTSSNTDTPNNSENNPSTETESSNIPTRFNNLKLTLGKNVKITRAPILNFTATGSLNLTGSFTDPIPEGVIRLREGGVNLFTTQFNLVRDYEHKADFRKNQPRDPQLDIKLFAKVLDVVQSSDFTRNGNSGLGALESVQVEAEIQGLASQLNENLELRSTPNRSQTELVALLGGGFVDTQGQGAGSTLGLINIAGSAVFNNFQNTFNQIGTAFGLSDFRLFPTVISEDPEAGRNFSSLELAAEAGVDISRKVSVSALKILTASDPLQWGINYKINNEYRFRASTNFFDDNRAVIEFERRF
ncbi:translocation/assembly module TamB domain-containing protein [Calothrix sp. PCC 6303]|uniref:translocation/assembly module TamB domain-containing protein n=1 Tax=Calothrix sp. PCC 6303 TaxID=1170562 RepID=UPI0002A0090E|nr:translocation/assembly module TamB domain-containing protein [Calothrix sp. PCC 6303]AFY99702.1 protein of unknown function DUF490 [Calothrix sp. PCC 6303]